MCLATVRRQVERRSFFWCPDDWRRISRRSSFCGSTEIGEVAGVARWRRRARKGGCLGARCAASDSIKDGDLVLAMPLAIRIHEGLVWSNRDLRTLLDKMLAPLASPPSTSLSTSSPTPIMPRTRSSPSRTTITSSPATGLRACWKALRSASISRSLILWP